MEFKNKKIALNCISDARVMLLGIATILVTFFHSDLLNIFDIISIKFIANTLNFVQKIGNYGVDIFLFLSGIGLYFSNSRNNIKTFYKNRFIRIMPQFIIITIIYAFVSKTMTPIDVIETIFFISFFVKGIQDVWFIPFIMIMYLFFPLIYKIIKKYDFPGLLSLLFIVLIYNLLHFILFQNNYYSIELALTRIPVFLFGVYFGKMIFNKQKISLYILLISVVMQILLTIVLYINIDLNYFSIFARYIYCFLTISSVINFSFLYSMLKNKNNLFINVIKFIGIYSLEIYLIFEKVEYIFGKFYNLSSMFLFYILCFLMTLFLSYIIKQVVNLLLKLIVDLHQKHKNI